MYFANSLINTDKIEYFNRKLWFHDGNILHITQPNFWSAFQQYRNVNRHIDWLDNEISSINNQINTIKQHILLLSHTQRKPSSVNVSSLNVTFLSLNNKTSSPSPSPIKIVRNQRNIQIIKLLSTESLFDDYREDLIEIYEIVLKTTIECIAIVVEKHSVEKYLFIKLSNGTIDSYQMIRSKSLRETSWRMNQSLSVWNNADRRLEYYRRFIQDNKTNVIMLSDQLTEIKSRPKLQSAHFFYMMEQILRVKYHTDPSSLSCILESFFDSIYTCDGRLVYPHELRLLSNDNLFVFYAVMMDTKVDKQIYPLNKNNRIRHGDQIYFLFNNHPQFHSLSALSCPECIRNEKTFLFDINQEIIERHVDNGIDETPPTFSVEENLLHTNIQNFIVYAFVTSIVLYALKQSTTSRRHRQFSSIKKFLFK
ncbi:unnamed protein product [Adineta ricciae]|uniref:Uncharacterized protein n=1 Tax=Adineta ricciae TaxID=249248 RepID=A0A813T2Q8_ADIRI|nr:unnamed protein product [Adineta ricciae]